MTNKHTVWLGAFAAVFLPAPNAAHAQVPDSMPVQGTLTDSGGTPIDGPQTIQFRIYPVDTGGTALFDETQLVTVADGVFTAYLGDIQTLDLGIFDGQDLWLGIKVGGDLEMMPRLKIASVPYAAYSGATASVPPGAVMFFDLAACPTGWSTFAPLQGRVAVGLPSGGTLGGTVGTALADEGARNISSVTSHSHSNSPGTITVGQTPRGSHGHTVDPAAFNSGNQSASHIHSGTSGSQNASHAHSGTTSSDTHDHQLLQRNGGISTGYSQGASSGGSSYSGRGPIGSDTHSHSVSLNNQSRSHQHGFTTGGISANHTHAVNVPLTSTAGNPANHNHSVTASMASFTSGSTGSGTVDVTMPYVQLLACKKD